MFARSRFAGKRPRIIFMRVRSQPSGQELILCCSQFEASAAAADNCPRSHIAFALSKNRSFGCFRWALVGPGVFYLKLSTAFKDRICLERSPGKARGVLPEASGKHWRTGVIS